MRPVTIKQEEEDVPSELSNDIMFSTLCEPEHCYSIQVDTPQPTLMSSPRPSINPQCVFYEEHIPAPGSPQNHPSLYFSSDETIVMSQAPSSAGYALGMPQFTYSRPASAYVFEPQLTPSRYSQVNASRPVSRPGSRFRPVSAGWLVMAQPAQLAIQQAHQQQFVQATPPPVMPLAPVVVPPPIESPVQEDITPKRKRGRPPKTATTATPRQDPPRTRPKPARVMRTPKTPRITYHQSPTPIRRSRGCWTCKCRRKKCDEGSPSCTMCTKLDLPCLGYSEEKPDCVSTPEKTEETRSIMSKYSKMRKDLLKKSKDGFCPTELDLPKRELFKTLGAENDGEA